MALKRIRPTTASMYNNLQPIIASIIAILIGQDVFSLDKPIAALLVFTGVYLVTQSKAKEEVKGGKINFPPFTLHLLLYSFLIQVGIEHPQQLFLT